MTQIFKKYNRRSIRLKGYDYSSSGAYFITICAKNRECLFGDMIDGTIRLNNAGQMVDKWWIELANKYNSAEIDEYIIMPNHFHGIIVIVGADLRVCPDIIQEGQPHRVAPTLGDIINWFKTMTTNEYIRGVKQYKWQPFDGQLWQRNYYEHIIRNENELVHIWEYIINNPLQWQFDRENPNSVDNEKQRGQLEEYIYGKTK